VRYLESLPAAIHAAAHRYCLDADAVVAAAAAAAAEARLAAEGPTAKGGAKGGAKAGAAAAAAPTSAAAAAAGVAAAAATAAAATAASEEGKPATPTAPPPVVAWARAELARTVTPGDEVHCRGAHADSRPAAGKPSVAYGEALLAEVYRSGEEAVGALFRSLLAIVSRTTAAPGAGACNDAALSDATDWYRAADACAEVLQLPHEAAQDTFTRSIVALLAAMASVDGTVHTLVASNGTLGTLLALLAHTDCGAVARDDVEWALHALTSASLHTATHVSLVEAAPAVLPKIISPSAAAAAAATTSAAAAAGTTASGALAPPEVAHQNIAGAPLTAPIADSDEGALGAALAAGNAHYAAYANTPLLRSDLDARVFGSLAAGTPIAPDKVRRPTL